MNENNSAPQSQPLVPCQEGNANEIFPSYFKLGHDKGIMVKLDK